MVVTFACPCCKTPVDRASVDVSALIDEAHLAGTGRLIVQRLARNFRSLVSTETLVSWLYADDPNGGPDGPENVISVTLWRVRDELTRVGLRVEGRTWGGRRLTWLES